MKQPIVANFSQNEQSLVLGLLANWCNGRQVLWSVPGELVDFWHKNNWPVVKCRFCHIVFWPLLFWQKIIWQCRLKKMVREHQLDGLICLSLVDKILLTPAALRLGLPIVWLQLPEEANAKIKPILVKKYRKLAAKVKVITFGRQLVSQLQSNDCCPDSWQLLYPAVNPAKLSQQADLFDAMAQNQQEQIDKKYFVVGAVVDLVDGQAIEILLRSLKIVLSVIPSVQLVIIGDGPKRKEWQWLARQLDLGNLVWFVGRQEPLDRWFRSLDALIELSTETSSDWQRLLQAMSVGLPIVVPNNIQTSDFLLPGETALVVAKPEPEMIAQAIIQLQQDKILAGRLSWQSKEWISQYGNLDRQLNDFDNYLQE
ncbi:MAG TPA: glycosyltransferase [bacterium]|nr:glycosyltransferase [bacterium]